VGLKAETAKCGNGVKVEPYRLDRTAGVQIGDVKSRVGIQSLGS